MAGNSCSRKVKAFIVFELTEKQFYQFCSRHIDVNQLFADFNLVPSNQEEKTIIQELLDENPMEVGQTWYSFPFFKKTFEGGYSINRL